MRLRADMRRLFDRIARQFARLFGRVAAVEAVPARPTEPARRRFSAVRPGPFSPAARPSDAAEVANINVGSRDPDNDVVHIAPDPAPLPFGDFADRVEAERFAVLPPIGAGAADEVDWDALARALTGEP